MKQIWIIAKRELFSFFDSLIAYIMIVAFLGFSGFFTWLYGNGTIFISEQANLSAFFGTAFWTLFFFIPAITMRQLAEENKSGTLELLLTKPVNHLQIVAGKFLSTFLLIVISLLLTLPYYITVASIGPIDHGATILGYLGLLFVSGVYIGIGIMASSVTNNQIVSFLLALFIGIFFQLLFELLSYNFTGTTGNLLHFMSTRTHLESIIRGVLDSKDIIYFLSLIGITFAGSVYFLVKKQA